MTAPLLDGSRNFQIVHEILNVVNGKPATPSRPELAFVERFALLLTEAGMPRTPSRVFACLLATESGQLTAAELAERLQVSPAAVSGAVRYLAQTGLIARGRSPGSRRDHYAVRDDLWYRIFAERTQMMKAWEEVLAEGVRTLGARSQAGRRIAETRDFFAFYLEEMATFMRRWEKRRAAERAARSRSGSPRRREGS